MKPNVNETKEDFLKRFMEDLQMITEYPDANQRFAVANKYWEDNQQSALDILNSMKKLLEKNGYTIDDTGMSELLENVKIIKMKYELQESNSAGEGWILVFPYGKHYFEGYADWFDFNFAFYQQIADSFHCKNLGRPFIDKEHEYAESYGDILDYKWDTTGMYFKIKLNKQGLELVRNESYKYISPAFGPVKDITGTEHSNTLLAISLVNFPALMGAIPKLQDQITLKNSTQKKAEVKKMTKLKLDISKLNALRGVVSDVALERLISNSVIELEGVLPTEVQTVVDELLMALTETVTKLTETLKSKEETEQAVNTINEELKAIKTKGLELEAEKVIDEAIAKSQYHPVLKELKVKQYIENKENVLQELSLLKPIEKSEGSTSVQREGTHELSAEDYEIGINAGWNLDDPKELAEYKKLMGGK